ncbi:hypothetical protein SLE2022_276740 [Rubroshorea leprosula]
MFSMVICSSSLSSKVEEPPRNKLFAEITKGYKEGIEVRQYGGCLLLPAFRRGLYESQQFGVWELRVPQLFCSELLNCV